MMAISLLSKAKRYNIFISLLCFFRWLKDKFGVSWQIVPSVLGEMLQDKDANKSERVIEALLQMNKIDIQGSRIAFEGNGRP